MPSIEDSAAPQGDSPADRPSSSPAPERSSRGTAAALGLGAALCSLITACTGPAPSPEVTPNEPSSLGVPGEPALGGRPTNPNDARLPLPPPEPVRSLKQLNLQAAKRLVAANAGETYLGKPPEVLLAIPVLEVELNADGSVRRISVMRQPRQALDTVQLAINAVRRAAPYGDVSRMPRPWKFVETFLFDDDRRFKPRTLED